MKIENLYLASVSTLVNRLNNYFAGRNSTFKPIPEIKLIEIDGVGRVRVFDDWIDGPRRHARAKRCREKGRWPLHRTFSHSFTGKEHCGDQRRPVDRPWNWPSR